VKPNINNNKYLPVKHRMAVTDRPKRAGSHTNTSRARSPGLNFG
jgi:hypothetical protein